VSLSENLALVVAAGSENSTLQDDGRDSQITGNTAIAGASLNYANGPVELSGAVDGAYGSYRSTRTITVANDAATADATPQQWQIGAHLRAAYSVPMFGDTYYVKPFIDGHAIYVSNEAFTESGSSPFRLAVDGRSDTAILGGVGTEFGAHFRTSSGVVFHPYVSLAVEFDSALDWTTTAHFADQPAGVPFAVRTAGPGTLGRLAVGGDVVDSTHWSFSLMYDPDVGHGYTSQAGSARVAYRF
jgi:outer membrane autotransporter protein